MLSSRKFLRLWLPVVVWMALIYGASTNAGSSQQTSRIIDPFLRWLFPSMSAEGRAWGVVIIRKAAHLTEYAVLAMLLLRALRQQPEPPVAGWRWHLAGAAVLGGLALSLSDELFQTFWSERSGSLWDAALDTLGASAGAAFFWLVGRIRRRW